MTAERGAGGGGCVSHPSQLTTGLVIKSVTTSPTLAGERMLFILQVSILSEQTPFFPTDPASLLAGYQGFYSDFRQLFKEICGILGIFSCISTHLYPTQNPLFPNRSR